MSRMSICRATSVGRLFVDIGPPRSIRLLFVYEVVIGCAVGRSVIVSKPVHGSHLVVPFELAEVAETTSANRPVIELKGAAMERSRRNLIATVESPGRNLVFAVEGPRRDFVAPMKRFKNVTPVVVESVIHDSISMSSPPVCLACLPLGPAG